MLLKMNIGWIFIVLFYQAIAEQTRSELTNHGGIFQVEVSTKNIGRIKYRDGEVVIAQNQQRNTDFFFTPFPYLQFDRVECHENDFSDSIELALPVELYTSQLIQAVKDYVTKFHSSLCGNLSSSSICDVSLLPMNSIRLVQKSSRTNNIRNRYTLEDTWQSATLLLQLMEFVIYTSNMTVCEQLRKTLTGKCRLPNFEIHYTLHGQQTVQRQLEVNTEHITDTNMFNQIRAQYPSAESVLLTGDDFKKLLSESTDRITMTLRMQEGFENLQDPISFDKLLEQQLSNKQIKLERFDNKLWEDLYWTSDVTRPDRLAKIINSIIHKENNDSDSFIYDQQAARNEINVDSTHHHALESNLLENEVSETAGSQYNIDKIDFKDQKSNNLNSLDNNDDRMHMTQHDKQNLDHFDKLIDKNTRSSTSSISRVPNGNGKLELDVFGLFSIGVNGNGGLKSSSQDSNDTSDFNYKENKKIMNNDSLNEINTDRLKLNISATEQSHSHQNQTNTERYLTSQNNTRNIDQSKINTNHFNSTKLGKDTTKQHILSRRGVEKLLRELFSAVHLEGDIIKPRPIHAHLVKIGRMNMNTKLFSNTVLVRMRSNVHVLPLRCKPDENGGQLKASLTERIEQTENILHNLSSHVSVI